MADPNPGNAIAGKIKVPSAVNRAMRAIMGGVALLALLFGQASGEQPSSQGGEGVDQTAAIVSRIDITVQDYEGSTSNWRQMARDVISLYIVEGDSFSATKISMSLSALKECGRFRTIDADSMETAEGITLFYRLTPFKLIKEILIQGEYPLFENKVLNAMTVYPGDVYVKDIVDAQSEIVAKLFQREGYIDPAVVVGAWEDPEDSQYILFVNITKGPYYKLENIVFKGNAAFDDTVLKWRMKSWRKKTYALRPGRLKSEVFKKDIAKVRKFYRKQRFFDVSITYHLDSNPHTGMVAAEITIQEGLRYNITFEGNQEFWDRTLRKQLVLVDTGNRGGRGLRKSIKNIKALYQQAGYPEVRIEQVETQSEAVGELQRDIRLVIHEGPRSIVNQLSIAGNSAYREGKLKRQILTRPPGIFRDGAYVPDIMDEDLLMLTNLYHKKGYLDPAFSVQRKITPGEKNQQLLDIHLSIDEGILTRVTAVELEGVTAVPHQNIHKKITLRKGRPFRRYELKNDERRIAEIISNTGHPYVQVESHTEMDAERTGVRIRFNVNEGPAIKMGNTYYNGNFRTKDRILDRELEMKPGDDFSLKRMYEGQKNIRSMNIFKSVYFKPIGLQDQKEAVHLFAQVDEKAPYFFEANLGYESVKGVYAGSKVGDHNFLGLNKDAWLGGEISQTGYWLETRLFEPRFFSTRISADLGIFYERDEPFNQPFGITKYGGDLLFSRKLIKQLKGNLGFRFERREQFSTEPSSEGDEGIGVPRSIFITSPSISYDSRDSFIRPREGIFSFLALDLSKGIENSLDDFYKYRFEFRGFTSPFKRLTFAGRGSFGDIDPYGSTGIVPQDQLFFLGGTSTVRGFDQNLYLYDSENNPVGGEMAVVANVEARVDLGRNFEFSVFYDVGYLDDTSGLEVTDNVRDSVGTGLRYVTPIGAIGILYGHKLDPGPEESRGRVHFSVGYTF